MTHRLELRNVTRFADDANPNFSGFKHYSIEAENPNIGITTDLVLNNSQYIWKARNEEGDMEVADKTFDCSFSHVISKSPYESKNIFKIEGLKINGAVEYDAENHVFAVALDESQASEGSLGYIDCLNSLMNDHLDLFV